MEGNGAEIQVHSDAEDNGSAAGRLSNCSYNSEDDSLLGFEDDLEGDEEDGEELDAEETVTSAKNNEEVKTKRKRKQIDPNKRKRIRRILREDELTEVTISAQKEERERLRRLELQRSLAASSTSTSKIGENLSSASPSASSRPSTPIAVDAREKKDIEPHVIVIDSDDDEDSRPSTAAVNCDHLKQAAENVNGEFIEIISSDSEVDDVSDNDDDEDYDDDDATPCKRKDVDYENSGLHVDDSLNKPDLQGRVLVNVSHPADEEDIFLAPQIARVIKAHQVGYSKKLLHYTACMLNVACRICHYLTHYTLEIIVHILHTVLLIFPKVLTRRISCDHNV